MSLPNGLVVSNDGNTLYVGNSYEKLWRSYPINPDGSVGTGSVFFNPTITNTNDPDGMTIDGEGNLYFTGLGGIWVVKPTGELNGFIPITEFASNVTFGDGDYKTLYITCDGKVYSLRMKVSGKPISEPLPVSEFKKY